MEGPEVWQEYKEYTKDVTVNSRRLAFGAAALCWFFKSLPPAPMFPTLILWALGCVVLFFTLDLLQYGVSAFILRFWMQRQEQKRWDETGTIDGDYPKPRWIDRPAFVMWCVKLVVLLAAFAFIGRHLIP